MTPERIIDAARRMVESGGVDALSMRKLAADLGVAPTAIYWHVGGRDQLLRAVLDRIIAELPPIEAVGDTPRERIASIARAIRSQVHAAPVTHHLAQHLGRTGEIIFPGHLALGREFSRAGLDGADAGDTMRSILYFVGGLTLLEANFRRRPAPAHTTNELWSGVDDPDIAPGIVTSMSQPLDIDSLFDHTIDSLLSSVLPA